jgi:hypothetical protein
LCKEVAYLGHTISAAGVGCDKNKVTVVQNWPKPCTVKDVRSFLGFASYFRRFIQGFAKIAGPLHDLVTLVCEIVTIVIRLMFKICGLIVISMLLMN